MVKQYAYMVLGKPPAPACGSDKFACPDGQCKWNSWKCDGDNDCSDGFDEQNCKYHIFYCV